MKSKDEGVILKSTDAPVKRSRPRMVSWLGHYQAACTDAVFV